MSRMQGFALPADVTATVEKSQARASATRAHQGEGRRWYRFTNSIDGEAELLLFDEIGGWGTYAEDFDAELKAITAPRLTVRVNSPGGSVTEGIAIASMLRAHPADITVRVDGIAASIASVIAMAGDRLAMMPGSMIMIHEASGLCLGDSSEMAKMAEVLDVISDNIAEMYAAKAGGTAEDWRAKMRSETWLRAEDAVAQGLADEVVQPKQKPEPDGDEPEMRRPFDLTAYGYAGPKQASVPAESVTVQLHLDGKQIAQHLIDPLRAALRDPAPVALAVEPAEPEAPTAPVVVAAEAMRQIHAAAQKPEPIPTETVPPAPVVIPEPEPQHDRADDTVTAVDEDIVWGQLTAHLTEPAPDPWAELTSHLTTTTASPQRGDEA